MKRSISFALVVGLALGLTPAVATQAAASPAGGDTNPLGSLSWLPDNANEKSQVVSGNSRLVVVYDRSLTAAGQPTNLLGKGPFGAKFFAASDVTMVGHSPRLSDLKTVTGQAQADQLDQVVMGVAGDVRDGACSKLDQPTFSAAYSTTRTFFHQGATPYAPISGVGTCERVDSSVASMDGDGNVTGYVTRVTTSVPGFWIDVVWPEHNQTVPLVGQLFGGRQQAEIFYGSFFDTGGEDGDWYEVGDTTGTSTSVGSPGQYDITFSLTANPGAGSHPLNSTDPCSSLGAPSQPGTWADIKVQVPTGTTKAVFKLFPHGDWDLVVIDPTGRRATNGFFVGSEETETVPQAGGGNIPDLVPGEFTIRGCNAAGEPTVRGAVILTPHTS
ncbi:MAG TPA: hypothetical protein VEG34_00450 [Thermoanaerobaculia bacterium]|nr:hypothetical protein [Thermoanaerobaculia bacterium]